MSKGLFSGVTFGLLAIGVMLFQPVQADQATQEEVTAQCNEEAATAGMSNADDLAAYVADCVDSKLAALGMGQGEQGTGAVSE